MCGIVGIVAKKDKGLTVPHLEVFREMMICDSIRGEDSTGVFSVNDSGNASFLKLATHPFNLVDSKEYKDWAQAAWASGRAVIGHNRKATLGSVSNKNAHPFVNRNIIFIHNGNVSNFRALLHHKKRSRLEIEVDSHAAAVVLSENDPLKILPEFKGAFTFVWYDVEKKKLYFIRNEERPLFFANTDDHVYFASEGGMLHWLLDRRTLKAQITSLKPNKLLQFNLCDIPFSWEYADVEFKKEPLIIAPPPLYERREAIVHYLKNNIKNRIDLIPKSKQYNIHYGRDEFLLENELEEEQIVFSVADYKNIKGDDKTWMMWGAALDSTKIECIFHFQGSAEEAEKLAYANHLIGFVRRIKNKVVGGEGYQEVIVTDVRPVEITTSPNGVPITKDHWDYLCEEGYCHCGVNCNAYKQEDLLIERPKAFENIVICEWCKEEPKKSDEVTPDTPLQAGE